jgi:hypothetical protein
MAALGVAPSECWPVACGFWTLTGVGVEDWAGTHLSPRAAVQNLSQCPLS